MAAIVCLYRLAKLINAKHKGLFGLLAVYSELEEISSGKTSFHKRVPFSV